MKPMTPGTFSRPGPTAGNCSGRAVVIAGDDLFVAASAKNLRLSLALPPFQLAMTDVPRQALPRPLQEPLTR